MPGTNAGTGQPIAFLCPVHRRNKMAAEWLDGDRLGRAQSALADRHRRIVRTGRTRPIADGHARLRSLDTRHEYRCQCGHVGWSRHVDILRYPIEQTTAARLARERAGYDRTERGKGGCC